MREGVGEYDIHCEPKSYKFKLLVKLVLQHPQGAIFILFYFCFQKFEGDFILCW